MPETIVPAERTRDKRRLNLEGQRFGRLVVLWEVPGRRSPSGKVIHYWLCLCDCGVEKTVQQGSLRRGDAQSCGCFQRDRARETNVTHECTVERRVPRTYRIWTAMKQRCGNPRTKRFDRYGGRGIIVCPAWVHSFETFLADMGECPDGMSIDRIDNDGPYCPFNTRWASQKEQVCNRSCNRVLTCGGETMCLADWAKKTGINFATLLGRVDRGWSVERALTDRVKKRLSRQKFHSSDDCGPES